MERLLIIITIGLYFGVKISPDKSIIYKAVNSGSNQIDLPKIGEKIQGQFFVKGKADIATVTRTKKGKGNPIEDGTADEYEIRFSSDKLKPIKAGCCNLRLINEGDLNNDGTDEISLFQAPMNGCTYSMTTYTFTKGIWKKIVATFLIPTFCDNIIDSDLQKRIFKEHNNIYYYVTELKDESVKLIKKKVRVTRSSKA